MNPPSKYEKIWDALKNNGSVSLTANRALHPRIVKATIKRKSIDILFRMKMQEQRSVAILSHSISESVITFHLEIKKDIIDFRTRGPLTVREI